jgi:hypothetical protein
MKNLFRIIAVTVVLTLTLSSVNAQERVFLGKGDVQSALGLNNAGMNAMVFADEVMLFFTYGTTVVYEVELEWWTGPDRNRKVHYQTLEITRNIGLEVDFDARKKNSQVTGFWLTFSQPQSGNAPQIGDIIDNKEVIAVTIISSTEGGGLKVNGVLIPGFVLE